MKLRLAILAALLTTFGVEAQAFSAPFFFKKAMVIVLENTDYDDALKQPYLSSLAAKGATFTNFTAETHPSQPNYIAMVSGSKHGVWNDFTTTVDARHLGDLLEAQGLSWKVYAENYPGNCFLGSSSGKYARKHVPFLNFANVQNNPERCARVVNAAELSVDSATNRLPEFSLYIPNMDNDGHDTDASFADQWLATVFGPRIEDPEFMKDLLLIVTFDEADNYFEKNRVFTVFMGPGVIPGSVVDEPTNHYSILKLIEDNFALGNLGLRDSVANAIDGIWR